MVKVSYGESVCLWRRNLLGILCSLITGEFVCIWEWNEFVL